MSGSQYNQSHLDLILAPITSQIFQTIDEIRLAHWKAAGLLKPSVVKPVLASFDITLVRRKLGELSNADRGRVRAAFARILDLA